MFSGTSLTISPSEPHGIMFHHFCDDRHPAGAGAITAEQFRKLVDNLGRNTILSAETWKDRYLAGRLDEQRCLTFDDALSCQYDIAAPVLDELGIKGFFFVQTSHIDGALGRLEIFRYFRTVYFDHPSVFFRAFFAALDASPVGDQWERRLAARPASDYPSFPDFYPPDERKFQTVRDLALTREEYESIVDGMIKERGLSLHSLQDRVMMSADQMRDLTARGHVVGLHSQTHPMRMMELAHAEQQLEYETNCAVLAQITGLTPRAMSHPSGHYSRDTLEILSGLGVELGFRADTRTTRSATNPALEIPRVDHTACRLALGI